MLNSKLKIALATTALIMGAYAGSAKAEGYCAAGKTITFAGIDWESGAFITEVMKEILSKGYDCKVDSIPGNSVTLEQATANNDVQIFAEEWIGRSDVWNKAAEAGQVTSVGKTFVGAAEGWFVPEYLVKGDPAKGIEAKAPDLKSVDQLSDPKIVELFKDPEEPTKGRFLNCPSGWTCEGVNTAKLQAYKLEANYVNFRPGTGTALDAAIAAAYLQGEPMLFYYWSPTAIMGKYKLIQLQEPAYSDTCWKELTSADGKRDAGCAFPSVEVAYGVNSTFAKEAPDIIAILEKATFPLTEINSSLAYMTDKQVDATAAAKTFLQTKADIWGSWVSADAKARIEAAVK
ncbi:ABC transporter substrate-binding protein [Agrobacterium sp. TS43]|uniref:ABC transporter substrate-binding protein n=1 Tax=Agrobacterium TaxID=357 RepID=UPI00036B8028|nr:MULTISPECIES: ABC transporter substrate-binding protein [Agrobacterium]EPR07346.1 ABC transporter substrate-binding protein [Agrobacterium radiobacter DSM 30147]KDR87623.1 histidine ABC transporter substrate-binding protein [Agrobacterium tumefaciens GW4]KVK39736.1 ABC transporter substrate-binding protein [Agrobacterium sp. JL28]KVK51541.1 ABC transporter substrate-binding protein [Agrobacterium sp. LY4]KVK54075.1 ABC transporter substrate-binding protein [Agrobacterium sp. TS45]